jgi:hypothetical protein
VFFQIFVKYISDILHVPLEKTHETKDSII